LIQGHRILRNALVLVASQPVSWALTLTFSVIVPRNVGPAEWGEWGTAWWVGLVCRAALDFGINTVLLKELPRRPANAASYLGGVLSARLALAPVLLVAMLGFGFAAHYTPHTMVILAIVAVAVVLSYISTPVTFGLQAFESMHLSALGGLLSNVILTAGAIVVVKFMGAGVIAIAVLYVVSSAIGGVAQLLWLSRRVRVRPLLDATLVRSLLRQGFPYWMSFLTFTVYVWADGILLSLMAPAREVGWYNAGVQIISSLGFLPYAVTMAVFPALSRSFHQDAGANADLAGRSFRLLTSMSLPMVVGLVIVAQPLTLAVYGPLFAPASLNLTILALTLPPVYVATLVNGFVIAADRQVQWTWLMAAVCVVNPILNVLTIPYFHHAVGNGAAGAAVALVITDTATGVAALVLLPRQLRAAVRANARPLLRCVLATAVMGVAVWPLRGLFLPIPVLAGVATFAAAAYVLRVFTPDEIEALVRLARRAVPGRRGAAVPASPEPREPAIRGPVPDGAAAARSRSS
jgi:O-antigen/teichoic acid export membrane protein